MTLKEIPIFQVPEEPKKIVPEKKVPVIKKPEAPPPKGTYSKINQYLLHFCVLSKIRQSLLCIVLYFVRNCYLNVVKVMRTYCILQFYIIKCY